MRTNTGSKSGGTRFPRPALWWLSPAIITLIISSVSIFPTALVSDEQFRIQWRTPKTVTTDTLMLFGCGALALAFGALVGIAVSAVPRPQATRWPSLDSNSVALLTRASTVLTSATVAGYLGFLYLIYRSGLSWGQLFGGSDAHGTSPKDAIGTIPGLTTLTQLGMAAVTVSTVLLVQQFSRAELIKVLTIIGLALPRAYVYAERLSILELAIPVTVILAGRLAIGRRSHRVVARALPAVGITAVALIFGIFEYSRSWAYYRNHGQSSFTEFALSRLAGYYVTAVNNGQIILDHLRWPGRWPYDTLDGFWSAPGIEQFHLYQRLSGHAPSYARGNESPYFDTLAQFGNAEFNNPSGYVGPFVDYGLFGGLIFMFAAGVIAGLLYRQFCCGRPIGLLLYPVYFIGITEMPRYIYWPQGRVAYTWLALFAILALLARTKRADPTPSDQPSGPDPHTPAEVPSGL